MTTPRRTLGYLTKKGRKLTKIELRDLYLFNVKITAATAFYHWHGFYENILDRYANPKGGYAKNKFKEAVENIGSDLLLSLIKQAVYGEESPPNHPLQKVIRNIACKEIQGLEQKELTITVSALYKAISDQFMSKFGRDYHEIIGDAVQHHSRYVLHVMNDTRNGVWRRSNKKPPLYNEAIHYLRLTIAEQIDNHLKGISLLCRVQAEFFPKGVEFVQYQNPDEKKARQGNYYGKKGEIPTRLGINPKGYDWNKKEEFTKIGTIYIAKEELEMLRSVASPLMDTWSIPHRPYQTVGGGEQFFVGKKKPVKKVNDAENKEEGLRIISKL